MHVAGDAHYTYRNVATFDRYGEMSVHNRKELLSWLDKIIEDTQRAHNFHLVSDDEDVLSAGVAPGSPVQLPTFITFRYFSHTTHLPADPVTGALYFSSFWTCIQRRC